MEKFNVKRFKVIVNFIIAILFIVSVSFNLFIMSIFEISDAKSFKQALLAKELLDGFNSVESNNITEDELTEEATVVEEDTTKEAIEETTEVEEAVEKNDSIKPVIPPLYQDENIKVTYLNKVDSTFGLAYEFEIENTSDKPVTVEFSDIYIDGFKVELSELTCKSLAIGEKATGVLTLVQSEWEAFTVEPSKVEFRVTLVNPKSLLIRYESDRITFDI